MLDLRPLHGDPPLLQVVPERDPLRRAVLPVVRALHEVGKDLLGFLPRVSSVAEHLALDLVLAPVAGPVEGSVEAGMAATNSLCAIAEAGISMAPKARIVHYRLLY